MMQFIPDHHCGKRRIGCRCILGSSLWFLNWYNTLNDKTNKDTPICYVCILYSVSILLRYVAHSIYHLIKTFTISIDVALDTWIRYNCRCNIACKTSNGSVRITEQKMTRNELVLVINRAMPCCLAIMMVQQMSTNSIRTLFLNTVVFISVSLSG